MSDISNPSPECLDNSTNSTNTELAALLTQMSQFGQRLDKLEQRLDMLQAQQAADIPEDVVIAISAAVSAFLGHNAKVKQIHFRSGAAWAQQGRVAVQGHRVLHGVR